MIRCLAALGLTCSTTAIAAPADVNAHTFYSNAVTLQKKGMTAIFDKRTKPMIAQMRDAGMRVGAANKAAIAAGAPPLYCMSPSAKKSMGAKHVITMLERLPDHERRASTLFTAWRKAMSVEFPCL